KYHFAWNVFRRISLLSQTKMFFGFVYDTFLNCSAVVDGFVQLLYLAPDHVHLFVESSGELSPEEIATKIKQYSNRAIVEKFPSVKDRLPLDTGIWDEAYFVETVG
ncbi:MAG: transposase, partial [Pseudomonadota bacterium]